MNVLRTIHPVGQGSFFTERFLDDNGNAVLNVVYDCGAYPGIDNVRWEIERTFKEGEEIAALFISHLDRDHINGVPDLLRHCVVRRIIFPLVSQEIRDVIWVLGAIQKQDSFLLGFINDAEGTIGNLGLSYTPELIRVEPFYEENTPSAVDSRELYKYNLGDLESLRNVKSIPSNHDIYYKPRSLADGSCSSTQIEWVYRPFNYQNVNRLDELNKKLPGDVTCKNIVGKWKFGNKEEKRGIKKAYESLEDGINANSMVLYSGLKQGSSANCRTPCEVFGSLGVFCTQVCPAFSLYLIRGRSGCLYTGDFDASNSNAWKSLKRCYSDLWSNVGCIQVPHHGSYYSFSKELPQKDVFFFTAAGRSNKFHHPHAFVVEAFLRNRKHFHLVTEEHGSELRFCIRLVV